MAPPFSAPTSTANEWRRPGRDLEDLKHRFTRRFWLFCRRRPWHNGGGGGLWVTWVSLGSESAVVWENVRHRGCIGCDTGLEGLQRLSAAFQSTAAGPSSWQGALERERPPACAEGDSQRQPARPCPSTAAQGGLSGRGGEAAPSASGGSAQSARPAWAGPGLPPWHLCGGPCCGGGTWAGGRAGQRTTGSAGGRAAVLGGPDG